MIDRWRLIRRMWADIHREYPRASFWARVRILDGRLKS